MPTRSEKIEKGLVTAWLKTLRENPGTRWVSLRRPSAWLAAASAVNNLCPPEAASPFAGRVFTQALKPRPSKPAVRNPR